MGHLGRYHCPNCGNRRPEPAVAAESVQLRGIRSAAFTLRTPTRLHPRRAAAARALQRLQRARRRRPVPVAGRRAADHRGRARLRRPRLRARGDDRARRPPDLDPAGQEPGRRQRGPAHARARGRRARPLRRPQRPHRRRPRRLLGVGRRLGDARPARQAHDLLGHARRRARAADEVRRRADRPPARRRGPRDRARPGARRVAAVRSTPSPPTPRCSSCAACSPSAARPGSIGDDRDRLARRRVRRLHAPTCRCGASSPRRRPARCSTSARAPAGSRSTSPAPATTSPRSTSTPTCSRSSRRARSAKGSQIRTEQADAAGFELSGPLFGLILVPMQTIQLLPGRAARSAFLASAREHLAAGGLVALAVAEELEPFEADMAGGWDPMPPDTGERDGWRYRSFPVAIRRQSDRVVLERVRVLTAPDGTTSSEDDAIALDQPDRRRPRGRGPRRRAAPRGAARDRRDRRPHGLDGGDAAWLRAFCGSARCIRTS